MMGYSVHLAQVNDRVGLCVMTIIFTLMGVLAIVFRFYARRLTRMYLGADDWLALVSFVFILALNAIFLSGTIQGAITGHSVVVNNWPVSNDLEHLAQKYKYAFQLTEKFVFGFIKLSILFLWKRLFRQARSFVILCWVMIAVITAWFIVFFFITLFQCGTHWDWNWAPIGFQLTQCVSVLDTLTAFSASDLFTDFVILFMPIYPVWQLHMPLKKKVGVTGIFMIGFFTIGAGIARMYYYLVTSFDKEDNPDFIADFTLFILWSEIEANVAMLVCCMPTWGPVMGRFRDRLGHLLQSTVLGKWIPLPVGNKTHEYSFEMSKSRRLASSSTGALTGDV
ncbi:hypothetical protein F5Y15DRAFT_271074 [Xylariaceae sp. FL0016]|nr:hypothetical protein F5Y15DRAFT_271074 [Xylariaceae sp. FL0016]